MKRTITLCLLLSVSIVTLGCSHKLVMVHQSVYDLLEVTRENNKQLAQEALKRYDWHYERLVDNVDALVAYHRANGEPEATVRETLEVLKEERVQFIASLELAAENEKNLLEIRDALGYEAGADNDKTIMGSLAAVAVALAIALAAA